MRFEVLLWAAQLGAAAYIPLPLVERQDASTAWTYQGCYLDDVNQRTLAYPSYQSYNVQTVETCQAYCTANNFNYAGLEYSTECYCDYALPATAVKEPDTDCSMACAGNSSEVCGNANRLSLYSKGSKPPPGPVTNPGPDGWKYINCYADSSAVRTLNTPMSLDASRLTVAGCTSACAASGYRYAGMEYADECYCDTKIRNNAAAVDSGCNMLCSGNSSEFCGGSNRLNVYQTITSSPSTPAGTPSGWQALGCFTDDGGARTLGTQNEVPGGYTQMIIESCLNVCTGLGYSYAGLEYSQECYCGNAILNGGACASDQTTCYMPCKGNTAETCGGPLRLDLYYSGNDTMVSACAVPPASTSSSIVSSISSSTTASATTTSSLISSITTSSSVLSSSSTSISSVTSTTPPITSSSSMTSSSTISTTLSTSTVSSSSITTTSSAGSITITSTSTTSSASFTSSCAVSTATACPAFWNDIVTDLGSAMRDSSGQCTDFARAAIRYAFHDAAGYSVRSTTYAPATGGADGSLLLSADEIGRPDNAGLETYHTQIGQKLQAYRAAGNCITAADLIQVAGSLGVLACPGGRIGRVYIGRKDTAQACPDGLLPHAFGAGADHNTILNLFIDKGFSARDLAALMGAHSTSKANFQQANGIPAGTSQDTTPGTWDVLYYNETYNPQPGMARFQSDIALSSNMSTGAVGVQFQSFVGAQSAWGASFSSAWQALSLLGYTRSQRVGWADCTTPVSNMFPVVNV